MELRRALLLFAIVLGVAAIASSITRSPERDDDEPTASTPSPSQSAGPVTGSSQPTRIEFGPEAKPRTREIEVGQPATVLVDVEAPGEVDIPSLGLTEVAEPLTPAVFDVRVTVPGSHAITVQPATSQAPPSKVGTLRVTSTPRSNRSDRTVGAAKNGR